MKVFFLDTNIFLQCKPIEQLPWEEITGDDILLLISRPVQEQIDDLKQSGNNRRAKRARNTTSFFRKILTANSNIVIRQDKPHVEIAFSPRVKQENFNDYNLNPSKSDDQLVFEAINYRENHKKHDVAILTHDTGPAVTAKYVKIPCKYIPDTWLLPPEPDSRDKKIAELEQRVQELEKAYPEIRIECLDTNKRKVTLLPVKLPKYKPIENAQIASIMEKIKTKFPIANDFNKEKNEGANTHSIEYILGNVLFVGPKVEEIQKYVNEDYPKWLEEIETLLASLNTKLDLKYRNINFFISISNIGNVPAENVIIDFILNKGLLLPPPSEFSDEEENPQNISPSFPHPPTPPKGEWLNKGISGLPLSQFSNLISSSILPIAHKHDKYCFYWKPNKPITKTNRWTLECDEFRHQVQAEIFEVFVHFPPDFIDKNSSLEIIISTKNLPRPAKYVLLIDIEYAPTDSIEYAYSLINAMQ